MRQALEVKAWPGIYRPCAQIPLPFAAFAIRTGSNPLAFVNAVRKQVLAIDPDQAVSQVKTMEDIVEASAGQRRLMIALLGGFAGLALLLAIVGIYGVIAYSVAQRTKELGIRRALGAQQGDLIWLVLCQSLGLTLGGVAIGSAGAFALTRVMKGMLFQVSATDPRTFICIALLLVAVALAASFLPTRRATGIDPMEALR
jgi:ABC-type antimicrobial peptide transport system permease subunit